LSQITKTMLLTSGRGQMVTAVLPGDKRLDLKKLKRLTGSKNLRFMDKEAVEKKLGLVAGAIAPLGDLFQGLALFVDPAVFAEEMVDISSGDPRAGLEIRSEDLKNLLQEATITPIT